MILRRWVIHIYGLYTKLMILGSFLCYFDTLLGTITSLFLGILAQKWQFLDEILKKIQIYGTFGFYLNCILHLIGGCQKSLFPIILHGIIILLDPLNMKKVPFDKLYIFPPKSNFLRFGSVFIIFCNFYYGYGHIYVLSLILICWLHSSISFSLGRISNR